jgi:hypothetical protein
MIDTLPKLILGAFGILAILLLLIGIFGDSDSLRVVYENGLLTIQNVGDKPVQIKGITINDRADCKVIDLLPIADALKVGDSRLLMTSCEVVRTTITTADGTETYYFSK